MPAGTVINGVKDVLAVVLEILESAEREIVFLTPASGLSLAGTYGTLTSVKRFIQNGGVLRGVLPISRANIEGIRMRLEVGEKLRHSDQFQEVFLLVGDKQQSISALNVGVREYMLDTAITAFWSKSADYAQYLLTSFESVWSEAVPAEERIQELLKQGSPQA